MRRAQCFSSTCACTCTGTCVLYHIKGSMVRLQESGCSARPSSQRFIECWSAFARVREKSAGLMRKAEWKFQPTDPPLYQLLFSQMQAWTNLMLEKHHGHMCHYLFPLKARTLSTSGRLLMPIHCTNIVHLKTGGKVVHYSILYFTIGVIFRNFSSAWLVIVWTTCVKYRLTRYLCLLLLWSLVSPESDILPKKRARLTGVPEDEESPSPSSLSALSSPSSRSMAKQRNRRRCHFCRSKLELAQQEMGSCRCGTSMQLYANINTYREVLTRAHNLSRNGSSPVLKHVLSLCMFGCVLGCISDQCFCKPQGYYRKAERFTLHIKHKPITTNAIEFKPILGLLAYKLKYL